MPTKRREFLGSMAAGLAAPCDSVADPQIEAAPPAAAPAAPLPTAPFGAHKLTRLIVGGNPFYGYSHFNRLYSEHMQKWATPERVAETLRSCGRHGINTWQFHYSERSLADLRRHREGGGRLQWLLLSMREIEENHALLPALAKQKPLGIVHHGGAAERRWRGGELDKVRDFLKAVRDSGVMVGLSVHNPELLELVEDRNWDIDFYMTAFYYLTRTPQEFERILSQRPLGEIYLPQDRVRMCRTIRQTKKTCLCYKVLAAGRLAETPKQVEEAFRFAFDNIKPRDCIIVGMYPRFTDQVRDNAACVRRILTEKA